MPPVFWGREGGETSCGPQAAPSAEMGSNRRAAVAPPPGVGLTRDEQCTSGENTAFDPRRRCVAPLKGLSQLVSSTSDHATAVKLQMTVSKQWTGRGRSEWGVGWERCPRVGGMSRETTMAEARAGRGRGVAAAARAADAAAPRAGEGAAPLCPRDAPGRAPGDGGGTGPGLDRLLLRPTPSANLIGCPVRRE